MRTHPPPRRSVRLARVLGAVAVLTAAVPLPMQAQAPRLTVIGVGAGVTCAAWVAAGRSDPELEQQAFGFASAVAAGVQLRRSADPLANLDADAIRACLGDHCRSHLEEQLSVALIRMVFAPSR